MQHYTPAQTKYWLQAIGAAQIAQHHLDVLGARVANHASGKALKTYLAGEQAAAPRPPARRAAKPAGAAVNDKGTS